MPYASGPVSVAPGVVPGPDLFAYARAPVSVSNHTEDPVGHYVVRRLRFPSVGANGQTDRLVTVRYYEDATAGPKPLVVILLIWGGLTYPSAIVARDLVSQGRVNVMRVLGAAPLIDWKALARAPDPAAFRAEVQRMVARMRASVIDLRRLLDWAETRTAVDPTRIAMIGFSASTLQVAEVMASDARLAAAILVMGGAHPEQIFATCYGDPATVRAAVLPRFGWTAQAFADYLAPLVRALDPAELGSRLRPDRVLLFDAAYDDCVPQTAREALWNAIGRPTRVTIRSTHAGSFLGMTFLGGNHIRHRIIDFLGQALQ